MAVMLYSLKKYPWLVGLYEYKHKINTLNLMPNKAAKN